MKIVSDSLGSIPKVFDDNGKDILKDLHCFDIQIHIGKGRAATAVLKCHVAELDINAKGVTIVQHEGEGRSKS
jgi:hypothetical protein